MKKQLLSLLLALCMVLSLLPLTVFAGQEGTAAEDDLSVGTAIDSTFPSGSNILSQSYSLWESPISSSLTWDGTGYLRVEHIPYRMPGEDSISGKLFVERYDSGKNFLSGFYIPLELPRYGGVYICDDYNFVVVGQTNYNESDEVEVVRVIRYSKDWERIDSVGLFGASTVIPFEAGTLRFARSGDTLFVRTCREMYAREGVRHQSNMTFAIDIPSMTVTSQLTHRGNMNVGYISHSFNQFIQADGTNLVAVDHGDAYPRSVVLTRYNSPAGPNTIGSTVSRVDVLKIADSTSHYNYTGVSVGGFEYSDTHYLVTGNSASQTGGISFSNNQRNVFVTATPKDNFTEGATEITWLTRYSEGDNVFVSAPYMVKLEDGRFFLIWQEGKYLSSCFLTADGKLDGNIYACEGTLSECPPIQVGNRIVWYVCSNYEFSFCEIDLNHPGVIQTPHFHNYTEQVTEATCTENGYTTYRCTVCGLSYRQLTGHSQGHKSGDWTFASVPTSTVPGEICKKCTVCGEVLESKTAECVSDPSMLESEHNYTTNQDGMWFYSVEGAQGLRLTFDERCSFSGYLYVYDKAAHQVWSYRGNSIAGQSITVPGNLVFLLFSSWPGGNNWGFKVASAEPIYQSECIHSYSHTTVPATCTEEGYTVHTCAFCGHSYETDRVSAHHTFSLWQFTLSADAKSGERRHSCTVCGETETETFTCVSDPSQLESEHYFQGAQDLSWFYAVAGAESLNLTFDPQCRVATWIDYLTVFDGERNEIGRYTGGQVAGQTVTVPGCLVQLHLRTGSYSCEWGFKVTSVEPVFPTHSHSYSPLITPPTCEEEGFTTHICECGEQYADSYVSPLGHSPVTDPAVAPTCTAAGVSEGSHCDRCKEVLTAQTTVPALGHTEVTDPRVEPTATSTGLTEGSHCEVCGEVLVKQEEIPKLTPDHDPVITFTDVPEGAWFSAAVNWAVSNNVTSGTGNGTFSPDMACSRSQVVTFLWRAAGSPEPSGTNPFSDVPEGAWYYKAVLWAVEKGVTSGTTPTTFAPDMPCSRSQVVTFLYRAAGAPEVSGENPFSDVNEGAWYYNAVLWAVENGITSGTTPTTFAPDMTCSRSQVVTFLYRAEG